MDKPLAGVRVLDLSRLLPGPYASLVLSDLGADVVKVEDPDPGDYLRAISPGMYAALNRGKRSVVVDLKSAEGAEELRSLCAVADVLIESFRPGVLERLGFSSWPPRLVVCRISGFGQEGPWRERAGHDIGYIALAGVLARNRGVPAVQVADLFGGSQQAVAAVLAALFQRERTGRGTVLDVAMTQGVTGLLLPHLGEVAEGEAPENVLDGSRPCYRVYECRGGGAYALGALEPKFWRRFCEAVARPEWIDRGMEAGLSPIVDALFAERTRKEWDAVLRPADCCGEPVLEPWELRGHPLFSDAFVGELPRSYPALVPVDGLPRSRAPMQGEHTVSEVLAGWAQAGSSLAP
ncbi:MAG TPA: CaiB/BaiF CoA-transferase family protein [Myxococcales bacterium]|nr:CaiB/BaiF CoA-transferase family protein [Myxococcales bacterium]